MMQPMKKSPKLHTRSRLARAPNITITMPFITHEEQPATVLREELHIHLAIGVVADDRREGKHEDGQGDKGGADLPHLTEQRVLRELDAVEVMVRINPTEEDDESRATAD